MLKYIFPVILAAIVGWGFLIDLQPKPCGSEELISLNGESLNPCNFFSESYNEARKRFRALAEKHGVESIPVFGDLTMDIAVIQGNKPGLVVHTSGVHGVEGFAGSAIQLAFLSLLSKEKDRPTVVIVHAVNPYGMSRYRRTNENNVDLNRNSLTDSEWTSYAGPSHYNKEAYAAFDALFNPRNAPSKADAFIVFWAKAIAAIVSHGIPTLKAAMVGGQYYTDRGIFYGGKERQNSISLLEEWLDNYLSEHSLDGDAVTWVDVHTGLGRTGEDTVLADLGDVNVGDVDQWFPDSHNPISSDVGKNVGQGYEKVNGCVSSYFCRKFKPNKGLCFAQEFGTASIVAVAHALVIENAAFHYSPSQAEALSWAQRTTRRAFYTPTAAWRASVLKRGVALLEQAMDRSISLSVASSED